MTFVSMYTTKNCLKSGRPITNRKIRYPLKYYFVLKNSKKMLNKKTGFLNWIVINVITIFSTTLIKLQYNKVHLLAWSCKYFMYMNVVIWIIKARRDRFTAYSCRPWHQKKSFGNSVSCQRHHHKSQQQMCQLANLHAK